MQILPKKPYKKVFVEITNRCNLTCAFCPGSPKPAYDMGKDQFELLLKEILPLSPEIVFHVTGEPTQHPLFAEFARTAHRTGYSLMLTTNGTCWIDGKKTNFDPALFRQINISLHAVSAISDPKAWLSGILDFCKAAERDCPLTYINLRLWNSFDSANQEIIEEINQRFGLNLVPPEKETDLSIKNKITLGGRISLNFDRQFEWPSLDSSLKNKTGFCHGLHSHFGILSDGTVIPCCLDAGGILALGNVKDQTLETILNSKRAQEILDGFQKGLLTEDLCRRCGYIDRFAVKAGKRGERHNGS